MNSKAQTAPQLHYSDDEQGNCFWSVSINEKQAVIMTVEDNPISFNNHWRYPLHGSQLQENKTLMALKDVKYFEVLRKNTWKFLFKSSMSLITFLV